MHEQFFVQAAVNRAPRFARKKTTIKHIQQQFKQEEQNKYHRLQRQVRTKRLRAYVDFGVPYCVRILPQL